MSFRSGICAVVLFAFLGGCNLDFAQPMSPALRQALDAKSVPFRSLIVGGEATTKDDNWHAVFHSKAEQDAFWQELAHQVYPTPVLPQLVDFDKEQGVMVLLGPQSTGMNWVEVVGIREQPDQFVVYTVLWEPPSYMGHTDDIGNPWHYIAMPRSTKPVTFAPVATGNYDQRPATLPSPLMNGWDLPAEPVPSPSPSPSVASPVPEVRCAIDPDTAIRRSLRLTPASPCLGQKVTIHASSLEAEWVNVALVEGSVRAEQGYMPCTHYLSQSLGGGPPRSGEFTFEFELKPEVMTNSGEPVKMAPGRTYSIVLTPLAGPGSPEVVYVSDFVVCP